MKTTQLFTLLIATVYANVTASDYNNKCVSCVLADPTFYYCTKSNLCQANLTENQSCEQSLTTCLNYKTVDLGIKEIVPFQKVRASFNYTLRQGQGVRFALSNQDSKTRGWFKLMLKTASGSNGDPNELLYFEESSDGTKIVDIKDSILSSTPSGVKLFYFDQNHGDNLKTDFVYSKSGKSYLKPLNTRFLYAASNDSDVTIYVIYGNTNQYARKMIQSAAIIIGMLVIYCF